MNAIDTLRQLLAGEPMEDATDWNEACAEWVHEHGADVEALLQAAERAERKLKHEYDRLSEHPPPPGESWAEGEALAAAVIRVKGETSPEART